MMLQNQITKAYNAQLETCKKDVEQKTWYLELEFERQKKAKHIRIWRINNRIYRKTRETVKIYYSKKHTVVLSYFTSEFGDTTTYSKEEISDVAFSELYTRAQTLIRALASAEVCRNSIRFRRTNGITICSI